ncbi:hypothetical protein GMSM_41660 [Geomonas sp. Red276]
MSAKIFKFSVMMMALVAALVVASPSFAHEKHMARKETPKAVMLRENLRDLWMGHVFWVRNVALMTRFRDDSGAKVAEENVVKNAHAIADSIKPLYGQAASDRLFTLLAAHYGAVKQYMLASYAGDRAGKDAASDKLKGNATEIAALLSGANPYWPKKTVESLLMTHGIHHMAQIDDLAKNDYAAEAQVWDAMKGHMLMIADALASGITKQFPKKF